MRPLNLTDFLLLVIAASVSQRKMTEIYDAYEAQKPQTTKKAIEITEADIDEIYNAYPAKDPNKGYSLDKSLSDRDRIRRKAKKYGKEYLLAAINAALEESRRGVWMKHFRTFLNNLPDISDRPEQKSIYEK